MTIKIVKSEKTQSIVKSNRNPRYVNSKIARTVDVDTARFVKHETPTPATDGAQKVFTVADPYEDGLLDVYLDGLLQVKGVDYSETTPTTFTMTIAPESDEVLKSSYIKQ